MRRIATRLLAGAISFCVLASAATLLRGDDASAAIAFNRDVRPILSTHCFPCHGPDSASREADLRLDRADAALGGGAILPGRPDESELIVRVTSDDPDVMMPPPEFQQRLNEKQKILLRRWIEEGANWEEHWSFIQPRKVALPQPPGVADWARNPIDHFVLAKLHEVELQPTREAEPHVLVRRAALDLTGLPPATHMIEDSIGASFNDDVYSRYVDALLTAPEAGEHRARFWLDAARYGDTHGMHVDNYREIWPYRDWVIQAFTANMPYDQFVMEQLAGDLLPDPTLDQRIATGFNRCNITTSEGGAIPEELHVRYMVDRVETTATVFLGLTAGCAVCHDHKYDPLSQREFYRLGAFFNNTTQPAMDGNQRDTPPVVTLPAEEYRQQWQVLSETRQSLRRELRRWKSTAGRFWAIRDRQAEHPIASDRLLIFLPLSEEASELTPLPKSAQWASEHPAGRRGMRFGEHSEMSFDLPPLRTDEPVSISFWYRTPDQIAETMLLDQTASVVTKPTGEQESAGNEKKLVGWRISGGRQGELTFELYDRDGQRLRALLPDNEALAPRAWHHVCVRYSGGQAQTSASILVNGRPISIRHGQGALVEATPLASAPLKIAGRASTAGLSDIRIYGRWINDQEVQLLADHHLLEKLLSTDRSWDELQREEQERFARYYDQAIDDNYRERAAQLAATQGRRDFIYARSTTTLVMQERQRTPRAWVLERGEYNRRRDEVGPGVPAVLPPLAPEAPRNRLGLARWLADPNHPLTARVMVNRLWQSVFGVGLVKTAEDFGVMGERPSHALLLDWLAVEFVESGWDIQHILKLMVTSATYRQRGGATPGNLAADPENRLLSRGPRLRLDAEVLRDQALAVSGLLSRQVGGPSVRPYQPAGLWKVVSFTSSNTSEFKQDAGDALYRRSLYTFWKRTSPPPSMEAFNAPTREQCTVRRERTNTPLQALVLMNDPQYFEAARRLAERTLRERVEDRARAAWMFRTVFVRPPTDADVDATLAAVERFHRVYRDDVDGAKMLIKTGDSIPDEALDAAELAAWTLAANTLMNRDDFICK